MLFSHFYSLLLICVLGCLAHSFGLNHDQTLFSSLIGDTECSDPLVCYINTLELVIPDSCFDIDGTDLCISDFVCNNFSLSSIPSEYKPPVSIALGIEHLQGNCKGNYKYGRIYKGTLTVDLEELDLELELIVRKNETEPLFSSPLIDEEFLTHKAAQSIEAAIQRAPLQFPESESDSLLSLPLSDDYPYDYGMFPVFTNFTTCSFTTFDLTLSFSNPGLEALSGVIEGIIKKVIDEAVCVKGNELLEVNVTTFLVEQLDPALYNITIAEADPYPEWNDHYLNWSESIVSSVHKLIDSLKGFSGLTEFVKCMRTQEPEEPEEPLFSSLKSYFDLFSSSSSVLSKILSSSSSSSFGSLLPIFGEQFPGFSLESLLPASLGSSAFSKSLNILGSRLLSSDIITQSILRPILDQRLAEKLEAVLLRGAPIPLARYSESAPLSSLITSLLEGDEGNSTLFSGLSVSFENVTFAGVETLQNLQLLEPLTELSNVTLRSALDMDYLTVEILLKLSYNESEVVTTDDEIYEDDDDTFYADDTASVASSAARALKGFLKRGAQRGRNLQADDDEISKPTFEPTSAPTAEPAAFYEEYLKISLGVENLSLILDLDVIVDQYLMNSLYLDQLGQSPGCWLRVLQSLSIPNFDMNFKINTYSVEQLLPTGQVEQDIVALVNNFLDLIFAPEGYGDLTDLVVMKFFQGPFRTEFNARMAAELAELAKEYPCQTHYPYNDAVELIVWEESDAVLFINTLLNEKFGAEGLNNLFNCATNGTGSIAVPLGDKRELSISGLNSFYEMELLKPYNSTTDEDFQPYNLKNSIGLGYCPPDQPDECNPLTVSIHPVSAEATVANSLFSNLDIDLDYAYASTLAYIVDVLVEGTAPSRSNFFIMSSLDQIKKRIAPAVAAALLPSADAPSRSYSSYLPASLANALSPPKIQSDPITGLNIYLENFSFFLELLLQVDKDTLKDMQLNQVGVKGCMASSIQTMSILDLHLNVTDAVLTYSTEKSRDITIGLSKLFEFLTKPSSIDAHNMKLNQTLSLAEPTCAAGGVTPNSYDDDQDNGSDSSDWKWQLVILIIACLGSLVGLVMAYNYWGHANRFDKQSEEGLAFENHGWFKKYGFKHSLLFHKDIPLWIRIATPIVIIANISLFMASNMIEQAVSVLVSLDLGDNTIDVGNVFDFGLANTVSDMWEAETYPLSILIAFFSGAWPYCKMLSMLCAWVLPPKMLSVENREHVLIALDILGKWSLIDFFVMTLFLCAFYFTLIIIPGIITVHVTVRPYFPFYSFLLATMISLGLGHTILACHRLVSEKKVLEIPDFLDPKMSMTSIHYEVYIDDLDVLKKLEQDEQAKAQQELENLKKIQEEKEERLKNGEPELPEDEITPVVPPPSTSSYIRKVLVLRVTRRLQLLFIGLLLFTALFVLLGTLLPTMGFEFKGLVGLMLKDEDRNTYSFTSIGTSIPEHSGIPNDFAIRWMQASFFLFGIGMPLSFVATSIYLWMAPLTLSRQRLLFILTEVFNAWSALDVFCIAIAAALLEIQQFVDFIIGDSCDAINVILEEYLDPLLGGDDVCFDVVAYLNGNSWTVFMAAIVQLVISVPSLYMINYAIKSRLDQSTRDIEPYIYKNNPSASAQEGSGPIHNPLLEPEDNKVSLRDVKVRTISAVSETPVSFQDEEAASSSVAPSTQASSEEKSGSKEVTERIQLRTVSTGGFVDNPSPSLRRKVNFLLLMQKLGFVTFIRVTHIEELIDNKRLTSTSRSLQRQESITITEE